MKIQLESLATWFKSEEMETKRKTNILRGLDLNGGKRNGMLKWTGKNVWVYYLL